MRDHPCPAVSSSNPVARVDLFSPLISAQATNPHPVSVVAAVLTGLSLGGLTRGVIAVPLAALTKLLVLNCWLPSLRLGTNTEVRP